MTFPAANAIYRRETYDNYPAARAILQVVYEGLQLPMDRALHGGVALVRENPALAGGRGDDPLAVRLACRSSTRARGGPTDVPPAQIKKVGIIGAGFMGAGIAYGQRAGRHRRRADRPRPGQRRQGQGAFAEELLTDQVNRGRATAAERDARAGAHHRDRRLRRARGLRSRRRGGVRGPQGEGRGHRQGAGGDAATSSSAPTPRRCRSRRSRRAPRTRRSSSAFISSRRSSA